MADSLPPRHGASNTGEHGPATTVNPRKRETIYLSDSEGPQETPSTDLPTSAEEVEVEEAMGIRDAIWKQVQDSLGKLLEDDGTDTNDR